MDICISKHFIFFAIPRQYEVTLVYRINAKDATSLPVVNNTYLKLHTNGFVFLIQGALWI